MRPENRRVHRHGRKACRPARFPNIAVTGDIGIRGLVPGIRVNCRSIYQVRARRGASRIFDWRSTCRDNRSLCIAWRSDGVA